MRNVEGAKAGSNQKKPYRAPVSVTSTQRMRIKYGISEGTIRGFSAEFSHNEMLKRIYLDGTPIMSAEGEQLLDVVVEFRDGSRDQEPINGLPSISVEHDVGVEVKLAAPVSRSFDRSDTTSYDVRISVPTLYQGDDEGNSKKGLIQFKIDVSTDGGAFEEAGRFDIYEKILNGFAETYNVVVPKGSNHVVRISRLNSEVVSDYSVNRLVVEAITENTDVRLRYTNTAVLYLEYDAEQFSNVPKLEMRVFGKNDILVPANYNGDTHTYATSGAGTTNGVWDGTWKRAYTDNPVWISLDLMISRRYGLGDKIDLTFINKWELYGLAQYCDEAVADGKGGFEPRFTCNNMYLQKSEDAYRVLKDLAASFRAKVVWDGEFITLQADVPRDPVHTFSNANASDITYSSTQDSAQRNLINVQYYDRDNKFASDVVMQRSNSNILSRGKVVDGNFTALGCASQGQAQRIASYVMNTELYETELVSFTTGLEGGLVRLNDVIQMADNSVAGQTVGGRIAAVNGRSITLDRKIPDNVQAIATTQLSINRQDVKNEPISIVSISDDRMTAVLASDAPAGTEAGLVWALLTQDLVPQKFVVTDIEFDSTNMTFAVSAIQYNESKYAAIDGSARIVVPPISVTEYKMLKAPIIVIASYLTRIIQDAVVCDIDVSWAQSTNAVQYQLEMQKAGSDWRIVGRFMSLATTLDNMYTGTYTFRVCAYDSLGNASQYTYSDPILVAGKVLPPPALSQYSVIGILFGYQHKWIYPAHTEDSRAVRLRFTTLDPVASPSQEWQYIDVAYPTANFTEQDVSAGLRTWFSAAIVDKYGNVGTYTAWQSAVPSVDATQVLDLLDGQVTTQQLDQALINKIAIGAEAAEAAESAQTAADAAAQAAANAQTAANGASVAASNAQTTASNAQTAANTAKTAAATAQTAASNAQTSANNAAASVNALATEVDADITALSTDLNAKLTTLGNGLTQETTDRQNADTQIVGQLNTYKSSNDAALAAVQQKAESATTASTANAQALTNLTATVNTKNRTYRQTTAPTAGLVLGDLWINTTAGQNNQLRRWNGTAWDDLTDPRTAANATALTNLQTTVTAIDGRTTANANSITQLRTDLTTLSNNVDAKADASAVDSLTTRVSTAEGNITSQGSAITTLQNTVNHATTGLATKASSSALTATNSEVTRINGVVTGHTNQLTQLASDITTINGNLATKADASALNDIYTKTQADEKATTIAAGEVSKFSASLGGSLQDNLVIGGNTSKTKTGGYLMVSYNLSKNLQSTGKKITIRAKVTFDDGGATVAHIRTYIGGGTLVAAKDYIYPCVETVYEMTMTTINRADANKINFYCFPATQTLPTLTVHWVEVYEGESKLLSAVDANSTAIQTTNAEVTRVDGVATAANNATTALAGRVSTVEGAVATKAEAAALTALTTRVTNAEGVNTSQGSAITTLQNTVNHATTGLATKASSTALTAVDNRVTAVDGRITTTNSNVTTLAGRVSTVESGLDTKADVNALTALGTTVTAQGNDLNTKSNQITELTAGIENVNLRGQDLVSNGLGQLQSNKYWSSLTFTAMDKPAGVGSFVSSSGQHVVIGDEFIAVDPARSYKLAYYLRQTVVGVSARGYGMIAPFDVDKNQIAPQHYMVQANTLTTLAVPLKKGDTTMTLTSAANWYNLSNSSSNLRSAIFWNYTDKTGYTWPVNTYSRNVWLNLYDGGAINGNVITLKTPWSGLDIPAGTQVSNGSSGGTYMYIGAVNPIIPQDWTAYSGKIEGTHTNNLASATNRLPMMTAYVKVGFLFNRSDSGSNVSSSRMAVAGVSIRDWSVAEDPALAKATALTSTNTEVSRIDGVVVAQGTSITNLQAGLTTANNNIATKADSGALSALTTRVSNTENSITTQSGQLTTLTNSLNTNITNTDKALAAVEVKDTRSTNELPLWYWTNHAKRIVNEFKTASVIGVTGLGTYVNLETRVYYSDASGGSILQTAIGVSDPLLQMVRRSSGSASAAVWTAWEQPLKTLNDAINTKASSSALATLDTKVTGIDGRVTANATQLTQLNSSLTTTNNNVTAAQNAADAAALLAGSKGKVLVQTAAPAVADRLVQNLWIDITGNANTPKRWNGSAWVAVTDKVATNAAAAAANALSVAQTKADASALTSLTTKVDTIDGKVTAQATQLSSLSTTVGNHTASISSQQTSINGLSAKATIQVAAGNTIGGVALGNNGGVVDFIVRANTFAIAPPVSAGAGSVGKYAFNYQATAVTLPNGTVVPAGLYLDQAVIGQISASKINADSLSAISANLGTFTTTVAGLGSTTVSGPAIIVKDSSNVERIFIGIRV